MKNLKLIQNNYDQLSRRERFGLYQRASLRNDIAELNAIEAATPKRTFDVIDFYFLREEIYRLDTVNLLQRLGHFTMFEMFMNFAHRENESFEKHIDSARLSAYLYKIETNAWEIVCDELGFEVNWFRKLSSKISFAVEMMEMKDELMQKMAFPKDEAIEFMKEVSELESFEVKTVEQLIKQYQSFIEDI
ncbi:MAG: hypothetical protein ACR2MD_18215 [Aridibacter sp.]